MRKAAKDYGSRSAVPYYSPDLDVEREGNESRSERRGRLRRHEMLELGDLVLDHEEEMRQERGLDW